MTTTICGRGIGGISGRLSGIPPSSPATVRSRPNSSARTSPERRIEQIQEQIKKEFPNGAPDNLKK
jgi:hypothetical protein